MHMYVFGFIERCFAKITVFNLDFQLYYLVALFSAVHPVVIFQPFILCRFNIADSVFYAANAANSFSFWP